MSVFLDKFTSNLRAVQSQQIMRILQKERTRGNITTVEEFQQRLTELTTSLLSTTISPTLQVFQAEIDEIIDSETLNFMLSRIEDDLNTAFNELDTIDEVLANHETLINDVVLKAIEVGINELDSKIRSFEFLAKTGSGFDTAEFNTFRITQALDADTKFLTVTDPRTKEVFEKDDSCLIDLTGEKLLLSASIDTEKTIASVRQIFDATALVTELSVETSNNDINKIIDKTIGTFWSQSTLLSNSQRETGLLTKLEINLASVQTISYLQIEPILLNSVDLISIDYLDGNNVVQSIASSAIEIKQSIKLLFRTVATNKLFLTFRNRTAREVQFINRIGSPVIEGIRETLTQEELIQFITPEIQATITSPILLSAFQLPEVIEHQYKYWEYFIGFDNIRVGLTQYKNDGIYTSRALGGNTIHQLGLRVLEKRPFSTSPTGLTEYTTDVTPITDDKYFHGSIEYYAYKLDYDSVGKLIHSDTFPVLPLGQLYVRHERLIFTERSDTTQSFNDVGFTQFYCLHNPQDAQDSFDESAIRVYRNGTLLQSSDVDFFTGSWERYTALTNAYPDQSFPMRYAIKVHQPSINDIYTVSYMPAVSTTDIRFFGAGVTDFSSLEGAKLVDLTGRLGSILGKDNIVKTKDTYNGIKISSSTVRLIVIMRRNSASLGLSPILEEYLFATGRATNGV